MNDKSDIFAAGDAVGASGTAGGRNLKDAMRRARLAQSVHTDVIVDLREAEIARLEILAGELAPVVAELPSASDMFDCSVVTGATPRLWVDMLGYVEMARDKRTYRMVCEMRGGRQLLLETANLSQMADKVTEYIAHRLIERERAMAVMPPVLPGLPAPQIEDQAPATRAAKKRGANRRVSPWPMLGAYLVGFLNGAVALLVLGLLLTGN
ncbi:MAG: hypothetical protein ACC634_07040 [Hyphomicrobiales bacterium]